MTGPPAHPAVPRQVCAALGGSPGRALMLGHVHPDADVLGSLLALALALEARGWDVSCAGPHAVPEALRFLPGADRYQVWTAAPSQFGLVVLTDCPNPVRTEGLLEGARRAGGAVLNIDHHPDNRLYGTVNWIEPAAAATGEMVFDLLGALGTPVTAEIALNLFTAIHTDTGSFRYSNTTARTFEIAAALVRQGVQPALVSDHLYQRRPREALTHLGDVLQRIRVTDDGQVAWLALPHSLLSSAGLESEDLVSYPRSVGGVKVAVLLREEQPGVVKASLRGKGEVAVNRIAGRFGGGGHENAAGCTLVGSLEGATATLLGAVQEALTGRSP